MPASQKAARVVFGSTEFKISYRADSSLTNAGNFGTLLGNDVALLVVPEPGTAGLLSGGLGLLLGLRPSARAVVFPPAEKATPDPAKALGADSHAHGHVGVIHRLDRFAGLTG